MAFMISILNGYVLGLGKNQAKTGNVTEEQYNAVADALRQRPTAPDEYTYKLKADTLEWELVELPEPYEPDDEATESDYIDALNTLGVTTNEEN